MNGYRQSSHVWQNQLLILLDHFERFYKVIFVSNRLFLSYFLYSSLSYSIMENDEIKRINYIVFELVPTPFSTHFVFLRGFRDFIRRLGYVLWVILRRYMRVLDFREDFRSLWELGRFRAIGYEDEANFGCDFGVTSRGKPRK